MILRELNTGKDEETINNIMNYKFNKELKTKVYKTKKHFTEFIMNKQYVFFYNS